MYTICLIFIYNKNIYISTPYGLIITFSLNRLGRSRIIHKKLGVGQAEHRYNKFVRYGRICRAWVGPLIVLGERLPDIR